jgi:ABC-2 type transport system permease protein
MNQAATVFPGRVAPNAWHAFGGIWRLTSRRFLGVMPLLTLAGVVVLLGLFCWAIFQVGDAKFYTQWTATFFLAFLVPVFAFLSGAGAMRDEMKAEAVDYVLTRPISRPAVVIFKFLSHLVCIQVSYMLALGAVFAVGVLLKMPNIAAVTPWFIIAQITCVTAFAAFGFLAAVLTSRYLILGLAYGGIIEAAVGNIPTQLSRLSMTHQMRTLLHPVLAPFDPTLVAEQGPVMTISILVAFAVVMLGVAAAVFSQQELAGARPGEV